MRHSRRSFLQASGAAALLGLSGCTGVLDDDEGLGDSGPPSYTSWMYDPRDLLGVETRGFATFDIEAVLAQRDSLPSDPFEGLEQANEELEVVDLEEFSRMTAVGGSTLNADNPEAGGSVVLEGSFDVDAITEEIESEGDSSQYETGSYEGYELYYGEQENEFQGTTNSFAFAIDEENVVVGGSNTDAMSGRAAAEAMIDTSNGDQTRYYSQSDYAERLVNEFSGTTMSMGVEFDLGTLIRDQVQNDSVRLVLSGLGAAGMAATIEGELATNEILLVYEEDAEVPEDTARDLLDQAREEEPEAFEQFEDVSLSSGDRTLRFTVEVDTQRLWEESGLGPSGVAETATESGSVSSPPQASFGFEWADYDEDRKEVTVTHQGGASVDADRLSLEGDIEGRAGWRNTSDGQVVAGSSVQALVEAGGYVAVVWTSADGSTSAQLAGSAAPN